MFLVAHLAVVLTWLVAAGAFAGIGLVFRRRFGAADPSVDDLFVAFWNGFGLVVLALILWNFIAPIDGAATAVVLVAGSAGLFADRARLARVLDAHRPRVAVGLAVAAAVAWTANRAIGPFESWDGSLYHFQGVRWAATYAAVPGIGNLHAPLAFNNSSFLYSAMLDAGPWAGRGFHVANGLPVVVLLVQSLLAGFRFATGGGADRATDLFRFVLLAPAVHLAMGGRITCFDTDVPTSAVLLSASALAYATYRTNATDRGSRDHDLASFAVLLTTGVCLKLSVGVFAALALVPALCVWRRRSGEPWTARAPAWTVAIVAVFAIAWMARGVVLSGYPLFPIAAAGFPVDWKVPAIHAEAEVANIAFTERAFAWRPGWRWVEFELLSHAPAVLVPLAAAAVAAFVALRARRRSPQATTGAPGAWWLALPALGSLVAWAVTAPSTRYSVPFTWTLAALAVAQCHALATSSGSRSRTPIAVACVGALVLLSATVEPVVQGARGAQGALRALVAAHVTGPGPDHGFHPVSGRAQTVPFVTTSGLVLNIPAKLDPAVGRGRPWDGALPCTPNPAPNLRLRVPGRMDRGFAVDGEWNMQDWPYYWRPDFLREWLARR